MKKNDNKNDNRENIKDMRGVCISVSRIMIFCNTIGFLFFENDCFGSDSNEWNKETILNISEINDNENNLRYNYLNNLSLINTAGGTCMMFCNQKNGFNSIQFMFPVLCDLGIKWQGNDYFRKFKLSDLVLSNVINNDKNDTNLEMIDKIWPRTGELSNLILLSPMIAIIHKNDARYVFI